MGLISQMMTNLYKPPKQEKPNTVLPKNLPPAQAARLMNQTGVTQGQFLKGQVLDLRANQILVLLENGATVSARTEGTLSLSIGETARFLVAQTTEDQILLKLAKEDTPAENPMIDKALTAANITKTERSVSIVTELLAHKQPVNESNIRHFLTLSAKYPEFPVKDLVLMELHQIPVTKENVEQFANYQDRNAKLLTQAQDMLTNLAETIEQLPEGDFKQEALQELTRLLGNGESTAVSGGLSETAQETVQGMTQNAEGQTPIEASAQTNGDAITGQTASAENAMVPERAAGTTSGTNDVSETSAQNMQGADGNAGNTANEVPDSIMNTAAKPPADDTGSSTPDTARPVSEHAIRPDDELLLKDFLKSFLLEPEDVADPEKVQKYYDELNEKLTKLEQLTQKLAEHTQENNTAGAPKQMRQNLSFMESVNQVFPYVQLPLKFRETPAHGELYVYEKKKALKPSDTLSALLHLEMDALGTMDIFVTLSGTHVTTRFSMTDKESGALIQEELPQLTQALAARGYTLQSEVSVREPEEENTPTLLEQFLEEHAPGGLDRYTFDIRA